MNKFYKAGIAGVAALAITAGGGTYALWSDYVVDNGNTVGSDSLKLTVAGDGQTFDNLNLAPGETEERENVITGRVGGADINLAEVFLTFNSLSDLENGCGGTNAEAATGDTCASDNTGEFSSQARVTTINVRPTTGNCSTGVDQMTLAQVVKPSDGYTLKSIQNVKFSLGKLADGKKLCTKIVLEVPNLPGTQNNVVMTDTSSFSVRYDLEQLPNP